MLYRLVRPMKRKGSSNQQFVQRIPADLQQQMVGMKLAVPIGDEIVFLIVSKKAQSIRFSLRTRDPSEIKDRQASASSYLEKVFKALRTNAPISLSHRNAVALSGDIYQAWSSDLDKGKQTAVEHTAEGWVRVDHIDMSEIEAGYEAAIRYVDDLEKADDREALEKAFGPIIDKLLLERGIANIDAQSRSMVHREFLKALRDGFKVRKRMAGSDYSVDPNSERFSTWSSEDDVQPSPSISLRGLLDGWWKEAQTRGLSESTYDSYRKAVFTLGDFLGHDDASRVTEEDVLRFKEHLSNSVNARTNKRLNAKTIKDSYLAGLRSVFGWAVDNSKLDGNPASDVTVKVGKKARLRDTWFSGGEVEAILSAASKVQPGKKEPWQRHGMKRWVPWLCAYSGARVGEMVQLRKKDICHDGERWIITITPEAVTVKTKERRDVPLHPHLVDLGFIDFVQSAPEGPLFMWSGTGRPAWRTSKNRLTEFIRTIVDDPNVSPNHGWRHTFKTIGSEVGIQDKVLDAICGHKPRSEGDKYGGVTIVAKAAAIQLIPRFLD